MNIFTKTNCGYPCDNLIQCPFCKITAVLKERLNGQFDMQCRNCGTFMYQDKNGKNIERKELSK